MEKLIIASRCALADLLHAFTKGDLENNPNAKQTIVDLYVALVEAKDDVSDYAGEVACVSDSLNYSNFKIV